MNLEQAQKELLPGHKRKYSPDLLGKTGTPTNQPSKTQPRLTPAITLTQSHNPTTPLASKANNKTVDRPSENSSTQATRNRPFEDRAAVNQRIAFHTTAMTDHPTEPLPQSTLEENRRPMGQFAFPLSLEN
ncbi:hypothetical protein N9068_02125 [bacterium]|nr:hypothetical protein [bacterium]